MWSVESARQLRRKVSDAMTAKQRWLAPIAWIPVKWTYKFAHSVLNRPVYLQRLKQVASRMNQHADTAFDGYTPVKNDVFAAAYFKAGTNLLMYMCYQISEKGEGDFDHIQDIMPWPDAAQPRFWMNLFDKSAYQTLTGRRVIKTHLPATKVPVNDHAKYIAVTRDPKDCAASGYYYYQSLIFGPGTPPPAVWLDHMVSKDAPFGRWDAFTASWYKMRHRPNVLFLLFDELKDSPIESIKKIAAFLDIDLTEDALERVVAKTSFKEMKSINNRFFPAPQSMWTDVDGSIIRKGQSGDGAALFNTEQLEKFDLKMEEGLRTLGSDFPYTDIYSLNAKSQR